MVPHNGIGKTPLNFDFRLLRSSHERAHLSSAADGGRGAVCFMYHEVGGDPGFYVPWMELPPRGAGGAVMGAVRQTLPPVSSLRFILESTV